MMNACITMQDLGGMLPQKTFTIGGSEIASETIFGPKQEYAVLPVITVVQYSATNQGHIEVNCDYTYTCTPVGWIRDII